MTNETCLFCDWANQEKHRIILENDFGYARWDNFPVSPGHLEIVPKTHVASFFDLSEKQLVELFWLLKEARRVIEEKYHPDSYNIGINDGKAAGQTIRHLHLHLIPRYQGDVEDPRGGIRNVIPGKGKY